ncbi:zinc finger protein 862-like [Neodiprion pinetum]|uniref:zinc finger protein 862-like n=1 Tax=Neodiprion pinetum TaxID=441929 RepID=UPI00370F86B1
MTVLCVLFALQKYCCFDPKLIDDDFSRYADAEKNSDCSESTTTDTDTTTGLAEDSYASDHCVEEPSKKRRKSYQQRFKDSWQHGFPWLEKKSDKSFCTACLKTINGGFTHLTRHEVTDFHIENMRKAERTVKISDHFNDEKKHQEKLVKSAELKLTMFLHEHNLPFLLMDHLPKLVASVCPDSKIAKAIKCCRTKATNLTKDVIAKERISVISEKLKNCVFSIIIDETTDINTEKSLAIVVRFYDNDECKDRFLGLIKVQSCTANDIFTAICNFFKEKNIPVTYMIGLAADNASVMMGNINGVQARFKAIIPHLFVLGCVCHSFHLGSSAAAKKLPRSLEDLIRAVYYFSHCSNRSGRLQEFQIFVELKPRKLLHPSATRWLSLQNGWYLKDFQG